MARATQKSRKFEIPKFFISWLSYNVIVELWFEKITFGMYLHSTEKGHQGSFWWVNTQTHHGGPDALMML